MHSFVIGFFAVAFVVSAIMPAEAQQLYVLEDVEVDPARTRIAIDMRKAQGAVRALRVRAKDGDILLSNVRVRYADGTVFNEKRRINLLSGERTRPINITRDDRFVDRVVLFVDPRSQKQQKVTVQILAHQSRRGRLATRRTGAEDTIATSATAKQATVSETKQSSGDVIDTTAETGSGEILFGAQRVGLGLDRDVIRVGRQLGKFRRIRMRVLENDIFLRNVTVVYGNGQSEELAVEAEIGQNQTTPWLNLRGNRFISEVQITYRSRAANFRGRARVELFGEYVPGWLGKDGEARRYNDGWVLLGAQTAGFVGFDNDVVPVGRNKGGFRQIRVRVRDRAITLNELAVVYGNGRTDTIPVKSRIDAGSTWGPVDLRGDVSAISEVQAKYRSRFFDRNATGRGAAIVEVWARY